METKEIFSLRNNFSIIGLTGKTGSGCTKFSKIISDPDIKKSKMLRQPEEIQYINEFFDKNTVFKRKYTICYNYFQKLDYNYKTISYISAILFYTLHFIIKKRKIIKSEDLIESLSEILKENYRKSKMGGDKGYKNVLISSDELQLLTPSYQQLIKVISDVEDDINEIKEVDQLNKLYRAFFENPFAEFSTKFYQMLGNRDYYLGAFFVHRLGSKIRGTANPFQEGGEALKAAASTNNMFAVVNLINKLIKAWKNESTDCHICIDSLRNSLEVMYFKERYSAFYMIAIHNEGRHEKRLTEKIKNIIGDSKGANSIENIIQKVIELDKNESKIKDFKEGHFFAPDVENCIQKSEIHINNPGEALTEFDETVRRCNFYTMTEQWMKIKTLISHPGIITPSHEERCMQIAFNSKFNSGCISRQVGAVITDEYNSIRSVGWNDVPRGSIACNLRSLKDVITPKDIDNRDESYSKFEKEEKEISYEDGGNFSANSKKEFMKQVEKTTALGLNHSFCFKSLHNQFEHKDNQVHTRSLHAEENAMLQISKYGGPPLKNGTLYTTASPCELCAKKAYQLGMKHIIYIDPYPGISVKHILENGYNRPKTKIFTGIVGKTYNKLFEPFLSFKDELSIINKDEP